MNTFTPNITVAEQTTLTKAIQHTPPGWQFYRKGKYIYAWKECWSGVQVGSKAPDPLRTKTARGLANRIQLYETGRKLVKGMNE